MPHPRWFERNGHQPTVAERVRYLIFWLLIWSAIFLIAREVWNYFPNGETIERLRPAVPENLLKSAP